MERLRWLAAGRRPWRRLAWTAIFVVAVVQVSAHRFRIGPDALAYLELGDAWWAVWAGRASLGEAVNGYWSPLQSWWLALWLGILRPGPAWESTVAHAGQLVVLSCCLRAFETLWGEVLTRSENGMPAVLGWGLGYALFSVAVLGWVTVWELTPDLWATTFLCLQAALHLRFLAASAGPETGPRSSAPAARLGLWIALGYLAKTALLPIAVIGVGGLFVATWWRAGSAGCLALARRLVPAGLVAVPLMVSWALLLSFDVGRVSYGEAGRLNYAWYVNEAFGGGQHWQGAEWPAGARADLGRARHPTRRIAEDPPAFEFATPVAGTYPPWIDPVYWHEGLEPRFELDRQLATIGGHLTLYGRLAGRQAPALVALGLLLAFGRGAPRSRLAKQTALLLALLALGPMAMYALVHVELRFLGGFGIFLGGAVVSLLRWPEGSAGHGPRERLAYGLAGLAMASMAFTVAWDTAALAVRHREAVISLTPTAAHGDHEAARALRSLGLGGTRSAPVPLASTGYGMEAYWARLAGARVVAEIYRRDDQPELADADQRFWAHDWPARRALLERLAAVGARAVVTRSPPLEAVREGWRRLGNSELFVLPLSREALDQPPVPRRSEER